MKFISFFPFMLENDEYIVEQYSGIKDINGAPIFEGDLVFYPTIMPDELFEVSWGGTSFVVKARRFQHAPWMISPACEIKGNIHETDSNR